MKKYQSTKPVQIIGSGPGKKYPRVNLPYALAGLIGRFYDVEKNGDVITLRPFDPNKHIQKIAKY